MDRRQFLVATALTPAASLVAARLGYAADDDGWIQLFNGKDLTGWTPKIRGHELGVNYADTFRASRMASSRRPTTSTKAPTAAATGICSIKEPFSNYLLRIEYRFVGEQRRRPRLGDRATAA